MLDDPTNKQGSKKARLVTKQVLSFADDDEEDEEENGWNDDGGKASPPPKKKKFGKDPTVDTSFLPDREREVRRLLMLTFWHFPFFTVGPLEALKKCIDNAMDRMLLLTSFCAFDEVMVMSFSRCLLYAHTRTHMQEAII